MTVNKKAHPLATDVLSQKTLEIVKAMNDANAIKIGANEVTKILNKGKALLVILAADCEPIEITAHLPILCENKNVPYIYINGKENLGKACDISRAVVACAVYCDDDSKYDNIQKAASSIIKEIVY